MLPRSQSQRFVVTIIFLHFQVCLTRFCARILTGGIPLLMSRVALLPSNLTVILCLCGSFFLDFEVGVGCGFRWAFVVSGFCCSVLVRSTPYRQRQVGSHA